MVTSLSGIIAGRPSRDWCAGVLAAVLIGVTGPSPLVYLCHTRLTMPQTLTVAQPDTLSSPEVRQGR